VDKGIFGPSIGGGEREELSVSARLEVPSNVYARWFKPLLDRILGGLLLVLSLPIIAAAGLMILVKLGRPIFYTQERLGKGGKTFQLYKLRTMIPDRRTREGTYSGPDRRERHKSPEDPRVPVATRRLRAMRLDELPQFLNVLKGDMSLVGPRPELPEIVRLYEPWQHQRFAVKPGVTGPWQISSRNGKLMHECTNLDLEYIQDMSLRTDLAILASTPKAMIGNRRGF
jgi:lipopolysaccharide/colanic/teichoic acid biosynthesis glycosyltransferase